MTLIHIALNRIGMDIFSMRYIPNKKTLVHLVLVLSMIGAKFLCSMWIPPVEQLWDYNTLHCWSLQTIVTCWKTNEYRQHWSNETWCMYYQLLAMYTTIETWVSCIINDFLPYNLIIVCWSILGVLHSSHSFISLSTLDWCLGFIVPRDDLASQFSCKCIKHHMFISMSHMEKKRSPIVMHAMNGNLVGISTKCNNHLCSLGSRRTMVVDRLGHIICKEAFIG